MKHTVTHCLGLLLLACSMATAQAPTQINSSPCGGLIQYIAPLDWPQFRFAPCHTGSNPYEHILSVATVGNLALEWKRFTGGNNSSPAVVNGVVYVGSYDSSFYALNARTGTVLWKYQTGSQVGIDSSPAVVSGVVYFGADDPDNSVYALNASTGALLWKYTTGSDVESSPAVVNGVLYVGSLDRNLYALKGKQRGTPLEVPDWRFHLFFAGRGQRGGLRRLL